MTASIVRLAPIPNSEIFQNVGFEVLGNILSYLDVFDRSLAIDSMLITSKLLSSRVIEALNETQLCYFNVFLKATNPKMHLERSPNLRSLTKGVLSICKQLGQTPIARLTFERIALEENCFKQVDLLAETTEELVSKGQFIRAIELAMTILEDQRIRKSTLAYIFRELSDKVFSLIKTGEFDKALKVADLILDEYHRSQSIRDVSKGLAKIKEFDRAIKVALTIPHPLQRIEILSCLSKDLIKDGKLSEGISVLNKAIEMIPTINCPWTQAGQLTSFAKKHPDKATELLTQAIKIIPLIPSREIQVDGFLDVFKVLAPLGQWNLIFESLDKVLAAHMIVKSSGTQHSLVYILVLLVNALASVTDEEERSYIARDITTLLARHGAHKRAVNFLKRIPIRAIRNRAHFHILSWRVRHIWRALSHSS